MKSSHQADLLPSNYSEEAATKAESKTQAQVAPPEKLKKAMSDEHICTKSQELSLKPSQEDLVSSKPVAESESKLSIIRSISEKEESYKRTVTDLLTIKLPVKVETSLLKLMKYLTKHEVREIQGYDTIYYINLDPLDIKHKLKERHIEFDDENCDYILLKGEQIAYRYEIIDSLGRGSFGQVVKCFDHKMKKEVALKVIKNKKRFHIQGKVEVEILQKLNDTDQKEKKNIVKMEEFFTFRNHLCIVFELLNINLYEFIKMNNFRGCKMSLIQRFAVQILMALLHCKKNNVIH